MDEDEIKSLMEDDGTLLKNKLVTQPEIQNIQQVVTRHIEDIEQLAKQNLDAKKDL